MIQAGTTLQQRYKIDKQIGQGGMGAVYVGTDVRFGSTVAIKETLCMDANFRKAIEREARLLNSLKHNALPRVSDHFEESASQFLVMEYIAGDDVATILERDQRAFPVEQVLKWADDLLDALDYLHNQDIPVIHRDIKPQNLKITPRGQIILLDFGLAKGNPTDAGHQTAAKSIFGYSRNYASLEQIQGTGTDPRSDLYSLAATLFHLITNTAPEDALTRAMSVLSRQGDPLQPANTLNREVPRGVAGVLHKALDLNAAERPASAAEMRQMLRDHENYAYLADPVTIAASTHQEMVFAQQTRLMPDETRAGVPRQTEAKTEILPVFQSQVTAVAAAAAVPQTNAVPVPLTSTLPRKRGGFAYAAGAFALLLVAATIGGGLYIVKPLVFGTGQEAENTTDTTTSLPVAADANTSPNVNSSTSQMDSAAAANNGGPGSGNGIGDGTGAETDPSKAVETGSKPPETTRNKLPGTEKPRAQTGSGDDISITDSDLPDDAVVTQRDENGRVTTTRLKPARIPDYMRGEPPNRADPSPRNLDLRNLTPEQRRRIQRVMRNANVNRPAPTRP